MRVALASWPWLLVVACPLIAAAQTSAPTSATATRGDETPLQRPGLIRVGPIYLTPYLTIGTLGLDTNVFYTATERRTDFTASGGPGLEAVLPLGRRSRFRLDGGLDYLYFLRTASQRRLNGHGSAALELNGVKTALAIQGEWERTYSRPNVEVDQRIQQETLGGRVFVKRGLSERFAFAASGMVRQTTTGDVTYQGTNLGATLTQDRYQAGGELRMALSLKTQLSAGGEQTWYRFPREAARDGRSTLAYGGLRTDGSALISGQALAGVRWFELVSGARREGLYVSVDAIWNISPRTKIGGHYLRDIDYSSFDTSGATPTNRTESAEVFVDKILVRGLYVRLFGRGTWLVSDGQVTLTEDGASVSAVRDDDVREGGGELGWQFRTRLRIGVHASYQKRATPFATFGIKGLLAGLTVQYSPPQPSFR